jgi:hypothetical protein
LSWWREGRENGEGWKFDKADDDSNNEEKKKHSSLLLNPFSCVLFCGRQQKREARSEKLDSTELENKKCEGRARKQIEQLIADSRAIRE